MNKESTEVKSQQLQALDRHIREDLAEHQREAEADFSEEAK